MGDYSRPKSQPQRRPSFARRKYAQMGHEGGPGQPSGGSGYSER